MRFFPIPESFPPPDARLERIQRVLARMASIDAAGLAAGRDAHDARIVPWACQVSARTPRHAPNRLEFWVVTLGGADVPLTRRMVDQARDVMFWRPYRPGRWPFSLGHGGDDRWLSRRRAVRWLMLDQRALGVPFFIANHEPVPPRIRLCADDHPVIRLMAFEAPPGWPT